MISLTFDSVSSKEKNNMFVASVFPSMRLWISWYIIVVFPTLLRPVSASMNLLLRLLSISKYAFLLKGSASSGSTFPLIHQWLNSSSFALSIDIYVHYNALIY